MRVDQLWRYPVKSMMGESVASAELAEQGMVGDRCWATRDEVRGGIRGAKKIAELMQFAAAYAGPVAPDAIGDVVITMPGGDTVSSTAPDVNERLSAALAHPVTLWPLQPATDLDHYRRGAPDTTDVMAELRAVFGRTDDEPLPDFSKFPAELVEFESHPGTYLDAYPLLVMSTSALQAMAAALPTAAIDVRRFRPNIVVDTGDITGHPEIGWVGRHLAIGHAELEIVETCPRCVMVTRQVNDELPADGSVLRHIVRDLGQDVGVYARVVQPGAIGRGDVVRLVD